LLSRRGCRGDDCDLFLSEAFLGRNSDSVVGIAGFIAVSLAWLLTKPRTEQACQNQTETLPNSASPKRGDSASM
jgi:hypothetical protein